MALLGGVALQLFLNKSVSKDIVNRKSVNRIQSFSLDAVIIMAIGTIDLGVVKDNLILVLILLVTGFLWNISCFLLTYKVLIPKYPFERGIADYGQSMGTTSIGLMLQSIADKDNLSNGKEAFGIKQLLFEPFVGGGLITALSPILIKKMGLIYFTSVAFVLTLTFFLTGYFYNRHRSKKEKIIKESTGHLNR
jgi:ESS family glutamate:Na+ symporter